MIIMQSLHDIEKQLDDLAENEAFTLSVQNIRAGKYLRDDNNPHYQHRLIYTQQLRNFVYNPAILNIIFTDKTLKERFFKLFGYQGNVSFTIYPDCWIRDLPLLDIGENAYLGDGILLGTNRVSLNQKHIRVSPISIGAHTVIDQHCSIGPDSHIGHRCALGYNTKIGAKVYIGHKTHAEENISIGNCVTIGKESRIGQSTLIGNFCTIEPGADIPPHSRIAPYSYVSNTGEIMLNQPRRLILKAGMDIQS